MRQFFSRVLGFSVFIVGVVMLLGLAFASFNDARGWNDILLSLGMPLMCVLILAGCALAGLGYWMMRRRRGPRDMIA